MAVIMSNLNSDLNRIRNNDRQVKSYKGEWYTINSIFGNE